MKDLTIAVFCDKRTKELVVQVIEPLSSNELLDLRDSIHARLTEQARKKWEKE